MRSLFRRTICKPSASGVARRGSSAEQALPRGFRRRRRRIAACALSRPGRRYGRPTTCAGRGATADPSAGAVPVRTPGRCSPSTCSGRAPRRAACRAVAPPRERRRRAGRQLGGCSCLRPARSARAGVAGAAAGRPTTGRATAPQTDHRGASPARAKRPAAAPVEPLPARARASTVSWLWPCRRW